MEIKLIIFDLDGVLIDSRDIHYHVLNTALSDVDKKYIISKKDHLKKFDGKTTKEKLNILSKERNLPIEFHETIWKNKQKYTLESFNNLTLDDKLINIFKTLKSLNIKIYICSNSIKDTVHTILYKKGLLDLVDGYFANEDVDSPKPHPEIYWKAMIKEKMMPKNTLILEDSYIGRISAISSGANLCPIKSTNDVTIEKIYEYMKINKTTKWEDKTINVLIPMAGEGSRFREAGYTFPKPLIDVKGKPMIQLVTENLNIKANFIFIVREEHKVKYNLESMLKIIEPDCKIVTVNYLTEGACCTTLLAEEYINNDNPLLIANSDQYIEWNSGEFFHSMNTPNLDGAILTFENTHPKWSYVKTDENGNITMVKEKEVISNQASIGIYYWSKGSDYVKYSKQMISKNIRTNNEFYVAPTYNEAILDGKIIKPYNIEQMYGLGDPNDLEYFLKINLK